MSTKAAATVAAPNIVLDAVLAFAVALKEYYASADGDAAWFALAAAKDRLRNVAIEHIESKPDIESGLFIDVRRWLQCDDEQATCFMLLDVAEARGLPAGDILHLCDAVEADLRDAEAGFLRRLWLRALN